MANFEDFTEEQLQDFLNKTKPSSNLAPSSEELISGYKASLQPALSEPSPQLKEYISSFDKNSLTPNPIPSIISKESEDQSSALYPTPAPGPIPSIISKESKYSDPEQIPKQLQDVLGQKKYASELPSLSKKDSEIESLIDKFKTNTQEEQQEEEEEPIALKPSARVISSKEPVKKAEEPTSDLEKQLAEASKKDLEERTKYSDLLKDALEKRDFTQLAAQLGKASAQIGAGIGGIVERGTVTKPVGMDIYDKMMDIASQPISDLEKKKAYETEERRNDPKSSESIAAQAIMREFGIKVPDTATASFLEKQFPAISSLMARREATEQRKESALGRQQEMSLRRQELALKAGQIQDEKTRNEFVKLQESLDPTKARSGAFGDQYKIVNQADRLKTLLSKAGSGMDLTGPELEEVALAQAKIIGGAGGTSRSQIQALVPHSLTGEVTKVWSWLSNNPTGTKQQEFVKRMASTIDREQDLARSELKKIIDKRTTVRRHLKDKNPDLYSDVLKEAYSSVGITDGQKGAVEKDPQVQKYADEHFGGNYNDALDFLEKRRKQ